MIGRNMKKHTSLLAVLVAIAAMMFSTPMGAQTYSLNGSVNAVPEASIVSRTLSASDLNTVLTLEIALKMRNYADFTARVHTGESIPEAEMNSTYYPLQSDYSTVVNWASGLGLTITQTDSRRMAVYATGTVAQIAQALHVTFAEIKVGGQTYVSAITAPVVPANIAAVLIGINGLQPQLQLKSQNTTDFTTPWTPQQIAQFYNANTLTQTGAGQTIAVIGDQFPLTTDLTSFWSTVGVSQSLSNITFINVGSGPGAYGSASNADQTEAALDVETTSGMAPGAKVRDYGVTTLSLVNINLALQQIINDLPNNPTMKQLSMSIGGSESSTTSSQAQATDQYLATLANDGVSIFVAAGDGSPAQVNFPASSPNVTSVGGTTLTVNTTTGAITSETASSLGGGGVSAYFSRPSWQVGTGVPPGTMRCTPDVSSAFGAIYMTLNGHNGIAGNGTSFSAPTWAAWCALINQTRTAANVPSVGLLNPQLYPQNGTSVFRDITSGSNSPNTAGVGYDLCTGLGVPNVANLLTALSIGFTTQPASQTVTAGTSVTFTSVAVSTTGATISYQWYKNGTAISGATSANLTISSPATSDAGSYTVAATDSTPLAYAISNSASLTVNAATTPKPAPAPAAASGGGGGGAMSDWFMGFLAFAGIVRWYQIRRNPAIAG